MERTVSLTRDRSKKKSPEGGRVRASERHDRRQAEKSRDDLTGATRDVVGKRRRKKSERTKMERAMSLTRDRSKKEKKGRGVQFTATGSE